MADVHTTLAEVFREEAGRLTAALVHILGDFAVAEEIIQDALLVALERWPVDGIPERPGAWLLTVARRRALNQLTRDARYREKLAQLEQPVPRESDDRLRLMFTCCHPALSRASQVALTLRAVCGFTTAEIAHAFLAEVPAVAQRIVRARRKIVAARIPYRIPSDDEMGERLSEVLAVLYLMFNEGYLASGGEVPIRRDVAEELRLLQNQDRTLWNRSIIAEGLALIEQAAALGRPGPYQVEAAIVACHAEAQSWAATDWRQIVLLYDLLLRLSPSPVVRLNRAVALWQVEGLAQDLEHYHLFHAIRGELLLELSEREQARASALRALELTRNRAEQSLLARRLLEW